MKGNDMSKNGVIPASSTRVGFTPMRSPTKMVLNLAAVREVLKKPNNYDVDKFVTMARDRDIVASFCWKHMDKAQAEVNIVASKGNDSYQFNLPGESETFVLATKFFSKANEIAHASCAF